MNSTSEKFGEARGNVEIPKRQGMSQARLEKTQLITRAIYDEIIDSLKDLCCSDTGSLGDDKTDASIERKADLCYGGDSLFVTDRVRGKIVVTDPEQVQMIIETIDDVLKKYGATYKCMNFFEDPKDATGYRCLNYKIKVPFPKGIESKIGEINEDRLKEDKQYRTEIAERYLGILNGLSPEELTNAEYRIDEIQAVAKQLEDIYHLTHPYKRRAENIDRQAKNREMTKEEKRIKAYCNAACSYYNAVVTRVYDVMIKDAVKHEHILQPDREPIYLKMISKLASWGEPKGEPQ